MSAEGFVIKDGWLWGYDGPEVEVLEIPEEVTVVRSVGENLKKCKEIIFKGHVKRIIDGVFRDAKIKKLYAPKGIEQLGDWAFADCKDLEEVIALGLKSIGHGCFWGCEKLVKLEIPGSCIIDEAFFGCTGLANDKGQIVVSGILCNSREYNKGESWFTIPDDVRVIGKRALRSTDVLTLPPSVITIHEQDSYKGIRYAENYFKTDKKFPGKASLTC